MSVTEFGPRPSFGAYEQQRVNRFVHPLTAAMISFGTTSSRYKIQQLIHLTRLGSHLTILLVGLKLELVNAATLDCSWNAVSTYIIRAYVSSFCP